jgi:hypothetical protein
VYGHLRYGETVMDEHKMERLNQSLANVMTRFREYFIGPGVNMDEEHVPFRKREDFYSPLVTVMGHTYGVRIVQDARAEKTRKPGIAVEISVNVYTEEFDLETTKRKLEEAYRPGAYERPIANFITLDDPSVLRNEGARVLADFFNFDIDQDLDLVQKQKQSPSKVTGLYVDSVLRMKYWLEPKHMKRLVDDPKLFESAVYLYCLRVFMAACRESLMDR